LQTINIYPDWCSERFFFIFLPVFVSIIFIKAFDPPSSHEAYCTALVTKTLMGEHSLTANQVTALTGVDG